MSIRGECVASARRNERKKEKKQTNNWKRCQDGVLSGALMSHSSFGREHLESCQRPVASVLIALIISWTIITKYGYSWKLIILDIS